MDKNFLTPDEICEAVVSSGIKKTRLPAVKLFLLGILAGAFIAFAAQGSNAAIHTIDSVGIAKALAGALFSAGLMFVIIAGGELFTGNCLIAISCLEKKSKWTGLLKNWIIVYSGNLVGSILLAYFINKSGQLDFSAGMLGAFTIKTAAYKSSLSFENAFYMGILCNWLVCLAVWLAFGAKDITGKIWGIFFPIWLFITSGFEHSVANMYYIPAAIIAKSNPDYVGKALEMGVSMEQIDGITWGNMFLVNLLPVTLGNILGGGIFVGCVYWFLYLRKK